MYFSTSVREEETEGGMAIFAFFGLLSVAAALISVVAVDGVSTVAPSPSSFFLFSPADALVGAPSAVFAVGGGSLTAHTVVVSAATTADVSSAASAADVVASPVASSDDDDSSAMFLPYNVRGTISNIQSAKLGCL